MSLTPAQLARAAAGYRALIRAQRFTFKGDDFALANAHRQTRVLFNRFIPSASAQQAATSSASAAASGASTSSSTAAPAQLSSQEIDEHIQSAFEIAAYLRKNVVQGKRTEDGNYSLRFTSETERGDNDTIKAPKETEARPLRPPTTGNEGVRRRRRKSASATEGDATAASAPAPGACCGGGSA